MQEIIDLTFKKSNFQRLNIFLNDSELFLIGDGSKLFNNNSFHLEDKFDFKSINFYKSLILIFAIMHSIFILIILMSPKQG